MRLTFARHGESAANVQEVYWNQPEGYGLTEVGRAQAGELADLLAGTGFAALLCSPVLRAVQTAEIVGARLGLKPEIADGLREYDVGILEGQTYSEETHAIYWAVAKQWIEGTNLGARIERGESYHDMEVRFMPMIRRLEDAYGGTEANVLLISHGGILRAMLPLLLDNVDYAFSMAHPIGYTGAIVVERRDGVWTCLRWREEVFER